MRKSMKKISWVSKFLYLLVFASKRYRNHEIKKRKEVFQVGALQNFYKAKNPGLHYSNWSATQNLVLVGDIETNLGPAEAVNN